MLQSLTSDDPEPSPFPRHTIKVFEEPRLREQDFGNFQPSSAEMTKMWHERAEYGHFFYRIPSGESAADAYDRVSGFNESLWRSFKEDDFASVCVLVTHGLMTRVFLMKWYHWSVEYFEDLRNMNHCEFVVMQRNDSNGRYMLKNQLRTWTQWQREQAEAKEEKQRRLTVDRNHIPVRTKWGANSDHDPSGFDGRKCIRQNTADLFREDGDSDLERAATTAASSTQDLVQYHSSSSSNNNNNNTKATQNTTQRNRKSQNGDVLPNTNGRTESSAPAYHSQGTEILQSGRDGGGTFSGRASRSGSESEDETTEADVSKIASLKLEHLTEEERTKQFKPPSSMRLALSGAFDSEGSTRKTPMADALGDQSDMEEDEQDEETKKDRDEEQSFGGSVR